MGAGTIIERVLAGCVNYYSGYGSDGSGSDGSGSDFPGIGRVGYSIFLNFRVSGGSGISYFFPGGFGYLV